MTNAITWTQHADTAILRLRAAGRAWPAIASELRVGRNSVIERARRLGLPAAHRPAPSLVPRSVPRVERLALPAGHPITWSAITSGTVLDQVPYPLPVFL